MYSGNCVNQLFICLVSSALILHIDTWYRYVHTYLMHDKSAKLACGTINRINTILPEYKSDIVVINLSVNEECTLEVDSIEFVKS